MMDIVNFSVIEIIIFWSALKDVPLYSAKEFSGYHGILW